jgi:hypothetical protein
MVVMEALMVQLPFPAELGNTGLLHQLGESHVPVKTFGSESVHAIITYKWKKFAERAILIKTIVYLLYLAAYTVYAIIIRCGTERHPSTRPLSVPLSSEQAPSPP